MSRRDRKTVNTVKEKVEDNSKIIKELSDNLVLEYCEELDNMMCDIKSLITEEIGNTDLEKCILNLSSILYFTGSAQEDLGIKEDVCRSIRAEVYNRERELVTGTIADKNALAELKVQEETIVLNVYSRAYRKVKLRMDAGYEMLNSLKKIMNKRISEMELSNSRFIGGTSYDVRN